MSDEPCDPPVPRRADRVSLTAEVTIRRAGFHGFRVQAFDLSPYGCKIEFIERPAVGDRVWVKFDNLQAIEAEVRWIEGHVGGLQFTNPLYEAVFRRLLG
jgi:hypothetical protein